MEQVKMVSWNVSNMPMDNIQPFLKYCAEKEVDLIFLQNVNKSNSYNYQDHSPYKLVSVQTISAQRDGIGTYAVFYNDQKLAVSSKGYLPIPPRPANVDVGQEARITANSFSQIQIRTLDNTTNQDKSEILKSEQQIALLNEKLAEANEKFAVDSENLAIAGYALFSLGSPPSDSETLARKAFEQVKSNLNTTITMANGLNEQLEVAIQSRPNEDINGEIQKLITANNDNAKANQDELNDLSELKKSLDEAEKAESATEFKNLAVGFPPIRQKIEKLLLNTKVWLQRADQMVDSLPMPSVDIIEVFNWAAPKSPSMPDTPNYGNYAFRRTLPFFNNPNDGSVPTGSTVIVLGDFNMATDEMTNENGEPFSNIISNDSNSGRFDYAHMVNFTPVGSKLVKVPYFMSPVFKSAVSMPLCAICKF